jgi:hypothetical protein
LNLTSGYDSSPCDLGFSMTVIPLVFTVSIQWNSRLVASFRAGKLGAFPWLSVSDPNVDRWPAVRHDYGRVSAKLFEEGEKTAIEIIALTEAGHLSYSLPSRRETYEIVAECTPIGYVKT